MSTKKLSKHAKPSAVLGSSSYEQLYLYAFATQGEIVNHVRTQAIEEESGRIEDILQSWQALQARVQTIMAHEAGLADQGVIEPIPDEHSNYISEIENDPLFKRTFSLVPTSFGIVEIDRLVAAQRSVNIAYVNRVIDNVKTKTTLSELLDTCISLERETPPIQHLEVANNTHVFSSPNLDLRFLGAFLKKLAPEDLDFAVMGGLPAAAIIAFIGYGGAPINVLRVQNRLVLNNGFHRVYALRSAGVKKIPVVIQNVSNWQLEFPPQVAGLPREYLLGAPRPALMKDFFESEFCVPLKAKQRMKVVTVQTSLGQFDVPS